MIREFKCLNPKSKFIGILNNEVINGHGTIFFNFYRDSENTYFPIQTSLYELINDGWVIVKCIEENKEK